MNAWDSGHMKTCSIHYHGATFNKNCFSKNLPHFLIKTNKYGGIETSAAMTTRVFNPLNLKINHE